MSVVRCCKPGCDVQIDTDLDDECVVDDPRYSLAGYPDLIICPKHREQMLADQESAP